MVLLKYNIDVFCINGNSFKGYSHHFLFKTIKLFMFLIIFKVIIQQINCIMTAFIFNYTFKNKIFFRAFK